MLSTSRYAIPTWSRTPSAIPGRLLQYRRLPEQSAGLPAFARRPLVPGTLEAQLLRAGHRQSGPAVRSERETGARSGQPRNSAPHGRLGRLWPRLALVVQNGREVFPLGDGMARIAVLYGMEESFPPALVDHINARAIGGVTAEHLKVGGVE